MPFIMCTCNKKISYSNIPCEHEWLMISDTAFDRFSNLADVEDIYNAMTHILKCPSCKRLWVFWNGFDKPASAYLPE